ncbi:MAG: MarR family transcriptional regulator [Alphaproteobacteria bacterium]|nr:MarR family transcriptional regulator [Alphaproteobacteria bacterium]
MAKTFDLDTSPSHLLRRASQHANDSYTDELEPGGLTQRQLAVLYAVDQEDGVSQTVLVQKTGIDRSTLADMIVRMQKKDLLARKRTEEDQRANSVRITTTGRRALKAAMPAMQASEAAILDALPARSRNEFIKCLTLIAQAQAKKQADDDDGDNAKSRKRR